MLRLHARVRARSRNKLQPKQTVVEQTTTTTTVTFVASCEPKLDSEGARKVE